jgi:VanZ family protein
MRILRAVAWLLLVAIIAVTLVPADLRPTTPLPLKVERALVFAILAFAFTFAYAKHWLFVLALICVGAVVLELAQYLVPTRDPSVVDAIVKVVGAIAGTVAARVMDPCLSKLRKP